MKAYENSFVRGASPTFSKEVTSENAMTATLPLPLGMVELDHGQSTSGNLLDDEGTSICDTILCGTNYGFQLKQQRNALVFWAAIALLFLLTIGNLMLTLTVMGVLHLGKGMQGIELIPEEDLIKFYGITDLDRIYSKGNGGIDGFFDVPVTITGDDGSVYIKMQRNGQSYSRMIMDQSGINFKAINMFEVKDPSNGAIVFTTHRPSYNMPKGAEKLVAKSISASKLTSPIGHSLTLSANNRIGIKGSEGITMDSLHLLLQAEHNIAMNSTHDAIILEGGSGIFLDIDKVPMVNSEYGIRTGSVQYKICVCMPQGTLFRIAIPRIHNAPTISCAHFNPNQDPCAVI